MLSIKIVLFYFFLIFSSVLSFANNSITYHANGNDGAVAAEDARAAGIKTILEVILQMQCCRYVGSKCC